MTPLPHTGAGVVLVDVVLLVVVLVLLVVVELVLVLVVLLVLVVVSACSGVATAICVWHESRSAWMVPAVGQLPAFVSPPARWLAALS
jgi:hypothetical protein